MSRLLLTALMLLVPLTASAVDDLRVNQLEQEVRDLKRQVQTLTRQVDELRNHPARLNSQRGLASAPGSSASSDWVDLSKWNRLRPGMTELEVLSALGPPTTMRDADGAKVLRYALEISSGGFLSGSVTLRDRVVVEVRKPELQ
jgi:hypothetical protein